MGLFDFIKKKELDEIKHLQEKLEEYKPIEDIYEEARKKTIQHDQLIDCKTGRFGTGFMTTYPLYKKVRITGKLTNDNEHFDFWLNRYASDIKEFY